MLITLSGKCPYPVGHYIFTDDSNFNPNTFYSGTTWEQVKGRTLVGVDTSQAEFDTVKKLGGEKSVKLVTANSPWKYDGNRNADNGTAWAKQGMTTNDNITAHNNLPPYKTTYIWTRTK